MLTCKYYNNDSNENNKMIFAAIHAVLDLVSKNGMPLVFCTVRCDGNKIGARYFSDINWYEAKPTHRTSTAFVSFSTKWSKWFYKAYELGS